MLRKRSLLFVSFGCIFVVYHLYQKLNASSHSSSTSYSNKNPSLEESEKRVENMVKRKEEQLREDEDTAKRFSNRIKVMKSQCPGWRKSPLMKNWVPNNNFLINVPRHILVCAVPKAGSTSWHMTVWAMRRKQAGLSDDTKYYTYDDTVFNHAVAGKLTKAEGDELITYHEGDDDVMKNPPSEKSRRLLLTRHPFARLISGWHQKFLPESQYAELLLQRYPQLRSYMKHHDPNHKMSFVDFAGFVANVGSNVKSLDYHFVPSWDICKPCQYAYTYVLKAESVDKDESWLRRRLNITDIDIGRKGVPPGGSVVNESPSENIKKYMSLLSDGVRRKLYSVYAADFRMFGYTFNLDTLESGGFD